MRLFWILSILTVLIASIVVSTDAWFYKKRFVPSYHRLTPNRRYNYNHPRRFDPVRGYRNHNRQQHRQTYANDDDNGYAAILGK